MYDVLMGDWTLLWMLVASDMAAGIAYFVIAVLLALAVAKRRIGVILGQLVFWMMSSLFILGSIKHILEAVVLWKPEYWLQFTWVRGIANSAAALIAIMSAVVLESSVRRVVRRAKREGDERYNLHLLIEKQNLPQLERLHQLVDNIDKKAS